MPCDRDPPNFNTQWASQFLKRCHTPNAVWDGAAQLVVVQIADSQNKKREDSISCIKERNMFLTCSRSQLAIQQSIDKEPPPQPAITCEHDDLSFYNIKCCIHDVLHPFTNLPV